MSKVVYTKELQEDPEVKGKINLCNDLKKKLEGYRDDISKHNDSANEAIEACKTVVNTETENLSGIYYEEKYLPYRDTTFEKITSLSSGVVTMLGRIGSIIYALEMEIEELNTHLWIEVEVAHTVYDDDY